MIDFRVWAWSGFPGFRLQQHAFKVLLSFLHLILGFCVFVASWRHALRSEWPFIIIIIIICMHIPCGSQMLCTRLHRSSVGAGCSDEGGSCVGDEGDQVVVLPPLTLLRVLGAE